METKTKTTYADETKALFADMTLDQKLAELKELREARENAETKLNQMIEEVKAQPDYQDYLAIFESLRRDISALTKMIHADALEAYRETLNKQPAKGIQIKVYTEYVISKDEALTWAKSNAPAVIEQTINEKMLYSILDSMPEDKLPTWAAKTATPKVTIATKL